MKYGDICEESKYISVSVGDAVAEFNSFTGFIVFSGMRGGLRCGFAGLEWC